MRSHRARVLILGAAGVTSMTSNVLYRDDPRAEVVAFTATQIPDIAGRTYPPETARGSLSDGIAIVPESGLEEVVCRERIEQVALAYSDLGIPRSPPRVVSSPRRRLVLHGSRRDAPLDETGGRRDRRADRGGRQTTRYVAGLL